MAKTATRKGTGEAAMIPPHSFPARQKKLGPAPFASFEDLSDDNDASPPGLENKLIPMPEIKEDGIRTPEEESGNLQFGEVTVIPSTTATIASSSSVPTSGPTSGLQTPSTPRIDISCASSSTPPSEESNSERELFQGGLGLSFHEEGADDLRSSTEELEFGVDDDIHDEKKKGKAEPEDPFRRASHPANIFQRKASITPTDEDFLTRKPSAHSLYLEGFLPRPCRHSSFGSADRQRPGAISSLSADGRRSGSPHKMLLETSFCGSKPIPTPSMDLDSPPRTAPADERGLETAENVGMLSSDSSFESHKPQKLTSLTTVQVHHHDHPVSTTEAQQISPRGESRTLPQFPSPDSPKSSDHWRPISPKPPHNVLPGENAVIAQTTWSPQMSSYKDSSRSPIQLKMSRDSVKSPQSPTVPQEKKVTEELKGGTVTSKETPKLSKRALANKRNEPVLSPKEKEKVKEFAQDVNSAQPKAKTWESKDVSTETGGGKNTIVRTWDKKTTAGKTGNKEEESDRKDTSARAVVSKDTSVRAVVSKDTSVRAVVSKDTSVKAVVSKDTSVKAVVSKDTSVKAVVSKDTSVKAVVSKDTSVKAVVSKEGSEKTCVKKETSAGGTKVKPVGQLGSSKTGQGCGGVETSKDLEKDEITTELKISEDAFVAVEDVPMETKGFFLEDSNDDDDELPYVPTTLPLEKSVVVPIIPIKERRKLGAMVTTKPTQRPRCVRPPNPASLNDYIAYSSTPVPHNNSNCPSKSEITTKMKINLPRDDSLPDSSTPPRPKSPKKKLPTSWTDFAEMGLRSPREIRRRMREENGGDDTAAYHSDSSQDTPGPVNGGSDDETESLLKLPKVPFAMDLDVRSNRSSVVSQEEPPPSPGSLSAQLEVQESNEDDH